MRIFRHIADVPEAFKGAVVAIGNFDGVHLGHQALIGEAARHAAERSAPLAVLAFEPCPQEFFRPGAEPFRLTPFRAKARLIAGLGADVMYALAFDAEMAHRSAQDFVLDILVKGLAVGCVVVGSDFRFGRGRAGDAAVLSYMGEMEGFGAVIFDHIKAGAGEKISSTGIRMALKAGKPHEVARLLGHPFVVEGRVEHGDGRGRELGFPTANMHLGSYLRPAFGIYAVRVAVLEDDKVVSRHDGVANLGIRPMYESAEPLLESHLFDFSGDLYGKHLAVDLIAYLRPEAKFAGVEALKAQIGADITAAKAALR
ncbi:MAG: bifunctional riboflavin kinase/FAD synthetase [Alphaproteobacteria bacterium]|nr:bifunctional riboflavin kinase/FAD synthetase [Alphaproteobacteria bacterium]MDE2493617.1 bifunctional riboflavin kinase/FAD synthetase [Alphaproteobacteria bacterium]